MKKWLVLHPAIWTQLSGGAEQQIAYLVEYLLRNNVEVHYVFEDKGIPFPEIIGLHLHPLKSKKIGKKLGNNWFLYRKKIKIKLDEIQPDIVYSRLYASWGHVASEYAKDNRKLHIWALSSDRDLTRMNEKKTWYKLFDFIENHFVRKVFEGNTFFIAQNNYQLTVLKEKWGIEGYKLNQSAFVPDATQFQKDVHFLIVWVGHLKPLKRPELFLKLVNECCSDEQLHFVMAGRGGEMYRTEIEAVKKKNPRFQFMGEQKQEDVSILLEKAHVLVNTSDYEGFPNTFVQAWMRGVVVLSSKVNPDGLLTRTNEKLQLNSPTEMKNKIQEWCNCREKWSELADFYQKNARLNHSISDNLKRLFAHLNDRGDE